MSELNEKLAVWRWPECDSTEHSEIKFIRDGMIVIERTGLITYKGTLFTSSLDACFKWLVPKLLIKDGCVVRFTSPDIRRDFPRIYWECRVEGASWGNYVLQERAETPALALCKAIEKLIDGGMLGE